MINQLEKEVEKQSPHFDFFKIKKPKKEKPGIISTLVFCFAMSFLSLGFLTILIGDITYANKTQKYVNKAKPIYSELTEEINKSNNINLDKFKELKNLPVFIADNLSAEIISEIVYNDKIDSNVKRKAIDFYYSNWNYGVNAEKGIFNDCGFNIICYSQSNGRQQLLAEKEEYLKKQLDKIKYTDNLEKQLKDLKNGKS